MTLGTLIRVRCIELNDATLRLKLVLPNSRHFDFLCAAHAICSSVFSMVTGHRYVVR
jgi:hypothetical protein